MIDEPPRGAEGLQGERAGSGCSCQGAPILGGSWGTPVPKFWGAGSSHVHAADKPTCATYLGDGGRGGEAWAKL